MVITTEALLTALLILVLRIFNNAIGTIRLIVMSRQQRKLTVALALVEAFTFAVTIAGVATDLGNLLNLSAYCIGFAAGNWVGMAIEARFIISYVRVNIFAKEKGHEIAVALRAQNFGVTESFGEGHSGPVDLLHCITTRREVPVLIDTVNSINPEAFTFIEEARSVQKGYVRGGKSMTRAVHNEQ
ncbi:MAG: DUF2179 domain-containing protein [Pleurocapsa minor GSE-CHR-MK-17-07R]|jgi:uncharacterized protein YebE (UPF0316 family)|nr:DUF2179 domain-containing protein [Pleurocapsa minor GSE-CHR-MK 17-07R]